MYRYFSGVQLVKRLNTSIEYIAAGGGRNNVRAPYDTKLAIGRQGSGVILHLVSRRDRENVRN
jgi:hypothetical protein